MSSSAGSSRSRRSAFSTANSTLNSRARRSPPTRKIKRSLLQQHFGHLISQMYSDDEEQRINRQLVH